MVKTEVTCEHLEGVEIILFTNTSSQNSFSASMGNTFTKHNLLLILMVTLCVRKPQ